MTRDLRGWRGDRLQARFKDGRKRGLPHCQSVLAFGAFLGVKKPHTIYGWFKNRSCPGANLLDRIGYATETNFLYFCNITDDPTPFEQQLQ